MLCRFLISSVRGSPPRTRGKVRNSCTERLHIGITPAYAGKSRRGTEKGAPAWDHPRVRGEKPLTTTASARQTGSPPRTRGKAPPSAFKLARLGITPAYAGKSFLAIPFTLQDRDHPRVRGEKKLAQEIMENELGSPPRTRGKVPAQYTARGQDRITPAYAGKRKAPCGEHPEAKDHPRVRGEKCTSVAAARPYLGSPPRTRGKARLLHGPDFPVGITPAYAGKSWTIFSPGYCWGDHPRVRGEKVRSSRVLHGLRGSPPRTRGKVYIRIRALAFRWITPAYAGKRHCHAQRPPLSWDHPRVRGEKLLFPLGGLGLVGSPPRTRGKVEQVVLVLTASGITPAYAGKSRP